MLTLTGMGIEEQTMRDEKAVKLLGINVSYHGVF